MLPNTIRVLIFVIYILCDYFLSFVLKYVGKKMLRSKVESWSLFRGISAVMANVKAVMQSDYDSSEFVKFVLVFIVWKKFK